MKNHSTHLNKARMDDCAIKVFHMARVQVIAFGSEKPVEQCIHCTIRSLWFKNNIQYDWVWSDTDKRRQYRVLKSYLPARLVCMFEITVENTVIPVVFVEKTLAVI